MQLGSKLFHLWYLFFSYYAMWAPRPTTNQFGSTVLVLHDAFIDGVIHSMYDMYQMFFLSFFHAQSLIGMESSSQENMF